MLEISAKSQYADVMERALYNTVLAGMALDGKSFFYVNPLEVVPKACHQDSRLAHVQPTRQKWFGCACCPPNIARLVSFVQAYAYTASEDVLYTHLYMGSELAVYAGEREIGLRTETDMPWGGHFRMEVISVAAGCDTLQNSEGDEKADRAGKKSDGTATGVDAYGAFHTFAFRIPGWSEKTRVLVCNGGEQYELEMNGDTIFQLFADGDKEPTVKDGYLYLSGNWHDGDYVTLDFTMETHMVTADPRVREDIGKVAFIRGPLTYCMEEADNGAELHLYRVDLERIGTYCQGIETKMTEIQGHKILTLKVPGMHMEGRRGAETLLAEKQPVNQEALSTGQQPLYRDYQPSVWESVSMTMIPYYAWANRGEGEMSVWVSV